MAQFPPASAIASAIRVSAILRVGLAVENRQKSTQRANAQPLALPSLLKFQISSHLLFAHPRPCVPTICLAFTSEISNLRAQSTHLVPRDAKHPHCIRALTLPRIWKSQITDTHSSIIWPRRIEPPHPRKPPGHAPISRYAGFLPHYQGVGRGILTTPPVPPKLTS